MTAPDVETAADLSTYRAIRFNRVGGADVLRLERVARTEPGHGEVRLRIEAAGLNRADVIFREGFYMEQPVFPSRIGVEAAGIIDAVGTGIGDALRIGQRVMTTAGFAMSERGIYAEAVVLSAANVLAYPDDLLTPLEAAAINVAFFTAWGALVDEGRLGEGDAVLLPAASGSVGLAALQIIRAAGATSIATCRRAGKREALLEAGADHVVVTDEEDLIARVQAITKGRGVRLVFDPVAGATLARSVEAASQGGQVILYGGLDPHPSELPLSRLLAKGVNVRGFLVYGVYAQPERLRRAADDLFAGLRAGTIRPVIARTFPLEAAAEAHRFLESNQQMGKVVLTMG